MLYLLVGIRFKFKIIGVNKVSLCFNFNKNVCLFKLYKN